MQYINSYQTRNSRNLLITQLKVRNNFFNFFPSALVEWNNLDLDIRNSSYPISKKNILTFIRPRFNNVFNISHPKGRSFPTCLRIGLSYLRKYKFKHSSLDTLNPICICGFDMETLNHFFLHYPIFPKKNLLIESYA